MSVEQKNLMNKKDIHKMFWRSQTLGISGNAERGGNLGYLYSMLPFLRKKYKDSPLEDRKHAMQRHLEYMITHHVAQFLLLGTSMALEEKTPENDKEIVRNTKVSLMGPLAGLGDSILSYTWLAICGSIGATLAKNGSLLGPIVMFIMINALWFPLKWIGLKQGYEKGVTLLSSKGSKELIQRFSNAANAMGTVVVAALVVSNVQLKLGLKINLGKGNVLDFQSMLDKILPNLLPVLLTFACYAYLKKTNGRHVVPLIIGLLVVGTLLYMGGIIA
ncbi:MAG: PTS system mannose/fructose/sorbose family transporter subunit IID [Lactobacillus sp.]|uniref:PTS system mannose/fructose/sorbose family transporter subunit IID n=1 Tax=Bombilactobacillus bombi TaxID=1303590 RepID=A0A417ZJY1_9LACO|nr:PTS system mannose/fructose/sorbose family transporter subunit IID [Bombilactobacillus bombi]MCO6543642.1 PTS system mannose/fructose/sorbose family transporter subunit IID [Lactobacillus sp.]RHW52237.1 PTS system mannose/fructose/sorbose family transporter subunit IID [Bombilactobacillus bombi]